MDDALEFFLERTAILQYEGGLDRADADYGAVALTRVYCERHGLSEPTHPYFYAMRGSRMEWSDAVGRARHCGPWVEPEEYCLR